MVGGDQGPGRKSPKKLVRRKPCQASSCLAPPGRMCPTWMGHSTGPADELAGAPWRSGQDSNTPQLERWVSHQEREEWRPRLHMRL